MTEQFIRDVAKRFSLDVLKRITTGHEGKHFATFELTGARVVDAWAAILREASTAQLKGGFVYLGTSDADGELYIGIESIWCEAAGNTEAHHEQVECVAAAAVTALARRFKDQMAEESRAGRRFTLGNFLEAVGEKVYEQVLALGCGTDNGRQCLSCGAWDSEDNPVGTEADECERCRDKRRLVARQHPYFGQ
jgi:hypothetical protein